MGKQCIIRERAEDGEMCALDGSQLNNGNPEDVIRRGTHVGGRTRWNNSVGDVGTRLITILRPSVHPIPMEARDRTDGAPYWLVPLSDPSGYMATCS